ncbi:MAG TPA: GDYXXLXY domain-containing protein [Steroidobacteraceae bacterium]|nr:GDYXXLXY domain-containing protein [Steroidobacteraceae bacterium]
MTALQKGLIVAAAQVLLVASVGAKFLMDRANYPHVWVETAPIDPDLPIRGRYVRLGILVDAERHGTAEDFGAPNIFDARLEVRGDKLVAVEDQNGKHFVSNLSCENRECWRLYEPLAYFIPEHVEDPSRRPADEKLWVEVTVPPKGAPRPIQLGVKKDGTLTPLQLR